MTTTSIRDEIRSRLDPIIEDIVSREIERGGGYGAQRSFYGQQWGAGAQQQQPFAALAPILLSTLMSGQQQQSGVQHPLATLALVSALQQQQQPVQQQHPIASVLPVLMSAFSQQQQPVGPQQSSIASLLPVLMSTFAQQQQTAGQQQSPIASLLPVLMSTLSQQQQQQPVGQQHPLAALALMSAFGGR